MRNRLINVAREKYSNLCDNLKFSIKNAFKKASCFVVLTDIKDTYGKRKITSTRFRYAMQALEFKDQQMNREDTRIYYYEAQTGVYHLWN